MSNIHCKDCGAMLGHVHRPGCPKLGEPTAPDLPELPPLPEPARWVKADGCWADQPKASDQAAFSILQMRAYAEEAVRMEREALLMAAHEAIQRALTEAGIRHEVLRGMAIEVGLEYFDDAIRSRTAVPAKP